MKGIIYGYCRVSSADQNLSRQIAAMKEFGIDERFICCDKKSGKDFDRKEYNKLVGTETTAPMLREGDLLVIYSLDRLGRNYTAIRQQWEYITNVLKADIKVLDMPLLDTRAGKNESNIDKKFISDLVLQILSYVAEKERLNNRNRQEQGIAVMPEKTDINGIKKKYSVKTGKTTGRPPIDFPDNWESVYKAWKDGKVTAVVAMEKLNLKKNSFYNLVKRYEV